MSLILWLIHFAVSDFCDTMYIWNLFAITAVNVLYVLNARILWFIVLTHMTQTEDVPTVPWLITWGKDVKMGWDPSFCSSRLSLLLKQNTLYTSRRPHSHREGYKTYMAVKWQLYHITMYPGQYNICHYVFNTAVHVKDRRWPKGHLRLSPLNDKSS